MTRDPARSTDCYSRFSILLEISCPRSWPSLNSDYALRTVSPPPNLHSPVIRGLPGSSLLRPGFSRVARRSTYKSNVAKRLAKGMDGEKNDKGKEKQQANYVSSKTVIFFLSSFNSPELWFRASNANVSSA